MGTFSGVEVQSIPAIAPGMQCNAQGVGAHSTSSPGIIFPPALFLISTNEISQLNPAEILSSRLI